MNLNTQQHWLCCTVLGVGLLASACPLWSQGAGDLPFLSGSTGTDGPLRIPALGPQIHADAMAYNSDRGEMLVLIASGQTWKWDSTNWTRILTATNPPVRNYSAMIYDEARQRMVLFGGSHNGRDTWTWDGSNWVDRTEAVLTASNAPSARLQHAMIYDSARQEVILFGGSTGGNESWIWNGSNWRFAGTLSVQLGNATGMSFDRSRQRAVVFGGDAGRRETWEWDGTNWMSRTEPIITDANTPGVRAGHAMAYDTARRRTVLFGGNSGTRDTWEWDGTNWLNRTASLITPFNTPSARAYGCAAYDTGRQRLVLAGGNFGLLDTWIWDGNRWQMWGGPTFYYDMSDRSSGTWNYSTIDVASAVTVRFNRNLNNSPLRWLATGNVQIDGILDLRGETGPGPSPASGVAFGGPGGFAGGRGALATNQSGTATGSPGDGPGGGNPGTMGNGNGQDGRHVGVYGNPYLQPLVGGSGGGGGASDATSHGGNGGGGGGAILISSSRDITVNGQIYANGGNPSGAASSGGWGSGGAIFLKADRISGTGILQAAGQGAPGTEGRIRLEAYYRQLAGSTTPTSVNSLPVIDQSITNNAVLRIASIDGVTVPPSPTGDTLLPDVVFTNLSPVSIVVSATAIPNSTPVRLRVATATGVILVTNVLSGASTTFTLSVPPGIGSVQAFAEFPIGN